MRLQSQWLSQFHLAWIARVSRSCTCNRSLTGAWQFGARIRTFRSSLQAFHRWSFWISRWKNFSETLICATCLTWPTHYHLWSPQKCCLYHRRATCSFVKIGPSVLYFYYWSSVSQFLSPITDLIVPFPPVHWTIAYSGLFEVEAHSRGCPLADIYNPLLGYVSKPTPLSPSESMIDSIWVSSAVYLHNSRYILLTSFVVVVAIELDFRRFGSVHRRHLLVKSQELTTLLLLLPRLSL